jgi:hypothetical protein
MSLFFGRADSLLAVTAAAVVAATARVTAALEASTMFVAWLVSGVAYVTLWVAGFVAVEVVEGLLVSLGHGACVAVTGVVAVVDVSVESAAAVVPGAGADEDSAGEPVGAVVAIGSAGVGSVVKVSVGAVGSRSDADGDLGRCYEDAADQRHGESGEGERLA